MLVDEALQIGLREELRRWVPDKFSAKLEFAHASIFLSFRAKSRNPVVKIFGNAAGFFDSAALRSE
jgi:hypothetical protein